MILDRDQRDYLASLVRMDARKKEKSLAKVTRHDGQTPEDFVAFVEGLQRKLSYQENVLDVLRDDDAWETLVDEDEDDDGSFITTEPEGAT